MTEAVGLEIFKGRVDEDTGLYKVVRTLNLISVFNELASRQGRKESINVS
jgi:hypothetical protein